MTPRDSDDYRSIRSQLEPHEVRAIRRIISIFESDQLTALSRLDRTTIEAIGRLGRDDLDTIKDILASHERHQIQRRFWRKLWLYATATLSGMYFAREYITRLIDLLRRVTGA